MQTVGARRISKIVGDIFVSWNIFLPWLNQPLVVIEGSVGQRKVEKFLWGQQNNKLGEILS